MYALQHVFIRLEIFRGFPGSSADKESICNAGDPSLIPGLGRAPGEGIGYPLQYSWVSVVAQMVKNPPAMQETWVQSLGWEDPLEESMATHSVKNQASILEWVAIPFSRRSSRPRDQTQVSHIAGRFFTS